MRKILLLLLSFMLLTGCSPQEEVQQSQPKKSYEHITFSSSIAEENCLLCGDAADHRISGRARLFEVVQQVKQANAQRQRKAPGRTFTGASHDDTELKAHPELAIDYVVAPPQMAKYMKTSTEIYNVYLKYVAPEDIHVYSIDEVFIDASIFFGQNQEDGRLLGRKLFSINGTVEA